MRTLALAMIPALLLPIVAAHSVPHTAVAAPDPLVLVDTQARCPLNWLSYSGKMSSHCVITRRSNGETPNFDTPSKPFGIAYAFNCGTKRRTFRMAVGLPGADLGVGETTVWVTKRTGRGYKMVTQKILDELATLQAPNWWDVMDVELKTNCAWHVVVVAGDETATAAHVPAIPPYLSYSAYTD